MAHSTTNDQLLREWGSYLRDDLELAPTTVRTYTARIRALLNACGKHAFDVDLADLRAERANQGTPASRANAGICYRRFFNFLAESGYIETNPSLALKTRKIPNTIPKDIPVEAAAAIERIATLEGARQSALCRLWLYQGLRVMEAIGLRWDKVDLETGWIEVLGKRNKTRRLPLHPKTRAAIEQVAMVGKAPFVIYSSRVEGRPITDVTARNWLKRWTRHAHVDEHVWPHRLRHTFATRLIDPDIGVSIETVSKLLGHEKLETTMIYANVRDKNMESGNSRLRF